MHSCRDGLHFYGAGWIHGCGRYDEASGLGSIDFAKLLSAWPTTSATSLLATIVDSLPSTFTPSPGAVGELGISVGEQTVYTAAPTGSVEVLLDGQVISPAAPLTLDSSGYSASTTVNYTVPSSPGGHVFNVMYPGDSLHAPSSGTSAMTVGSTQASGTFSLKSGNFSLSDNSTGTSVITVSPAAGYTGVVDFALTNLTTSSSSASSVLLCYRIGPVSTYSGAASTTLVVGQGAACTSTFSANVAHMTQLQITHKGLAAVRSPSVGQYPAAAALAVLLFGFWPIRRSSRRFPPLVAMLLFLVVGLGLGGCGGGSNSSTTLPPTTPTTPTALVLTATISRSDSVNRAIAAQSNFTITLAQSLRTRFL